MPLRIGAATTNARIDPVEGLALGRKGAAQGPSLPLEPIRNPFVELTTEAASIVDRPPDGSGDLRQRRSIRGDALARELKLL
jgi:hypothetical protein